MNRVSLGVRISRNTGSTMVEFVLLLGIVIVPVLGVLMQEMDGGGLGLLVTLRAFLGNLLVVIGLPFL